MKKIVLLGSLLLSSFSFASDVLNISISPYFKYQESNYSCKHAIGFHPYEFHLTANVQNGKLVRAVLHSSEWYDGDTIELSPGELAASSADVDYAGAVWLSKLSLNTNTLVWFFDHLQAEVIYQRCPTFLPLNVMTIDPSVAEFNFLVETPGAVRYAAPISLRGTRQGGTGVTTYEFSQFGLETQQWSP